MGGEPEADAPEGIADRIGSCDEPGAEDADSSFANRERDDD